MNFNFPVIPTTALIAIGVFIFMRRSQASRSENKRRRLQDKQDELIETLLRQRLEKDKK